MAENLNGRAITITENLRRWSYFSTERDSRVNLRAIRDLGSLVLSAKNNGRRVVFYNDGPIEVRRFILESPPEEKRFRLDPKRLALMPFSKFVLDSVLPPETLPEDYESLTLLGDEKFVMPALPLAIDLRQGGRLNIVTVLEAEYLRQQTEVVETNSTPQLGGFNQYY